MALTQVPIELSSTPGIVDNSNATAITIDSSENVGIGSSPAYKLDVDGSVRLKTGSTGTPVIVSTGSDSQGTLRFGSASNEYSINSGADYLAMIFNTNDTERMRIDSSGNVGIGTSSPATQLHVIGETRIDPASGNARLRFSTSGTERAQIFAESGANLGFETGNSERMRIDSSGNVGIGTSPSTTLEIANTGNGTAGPILRLTNPDVTMSSNQGIGAIEFFNSDATGLGARVATNIQSFAANTSGGGYLTFGVSPNAGTVSEAMRIGSSGNLLVGTTAANFSISSEVMDGFGVSGSGKFVTIGVNNNYCLALQRNGSDGIIQYFFNDTASAGNISVSGSTVTYNTSSDQRLKENIADADDAGSKVDAIQVRKFDWKVDGSHQDYGMVAQELQTVAPEAVSAPADPDEMMGVDYSKLVPMLVKEIQSLRARVAQLENN